MSQPFDPDAYLAGSGNAQPAAEVPVSQASINQFDPDDYLATKDNQQYDAMQAKYGGLGGNLTADALGAARGATFGTSDKLLTGQWQLPGGMSQYLPHMSPEDLQGYKDANPIGSFISSGVGSGVGAAAIGAGAAALGVPGAAIFGTGTLLGSLAEGGAFGIGNTISDSALGNSDLNAQKLLAGGLTGMVTGAFVHGAGSLFGAGLQKMGFIKGAVQDASDAINSSAETGNALASPAAAEGPQLIKGIPTSGPMAIKDAAQVLGVDIGNDATSQNPIQKAIYGAINHESPSLMNSLSDEKLQIAQNKISNDLQTMLTVPGPDGQTPATLLELGRMAKNLTKEGLAAENAPIQAGYDLVRGKTGGINLSEQDASGLSKSILGLPGASGDYADSIIAQKAARDIPTLRNLDDLQQFKSQIGKRAQGAVSGAEKDMASSVQNTIQDFIKNKVTSSLEADGSPEASQVLEQMAANQKNYPAYKESLNSIIESVTGKTPKGYQDAINMIDYIPDDKFGDKVFNKSDVASNNTIADRNPGLAAIGRQYQKTKLLNASTTVDGFQPKNLMTKILDKSIGPEAKAQIFNPAEQQQLSAAQTFFKAVGDRKKASGGLAGLIVKHGADMLTGMLPLPVRAAIGAYKMIPDAIRPNPVQFGTEIAQKFNTMMAVKKMTMAIDENISDGVKSAFGGTMKAAAVSGIQDFDKISKNIQAMASDPNGLANHMAAQMGDLTKDIPNISQGIHSAMVNGVSFLNSKIPKPPASYPMSQPYEPSDAQKAKFMNYANVVNDPVSALKQVKDGTINNDSMEALQATNPQLLKQMQQQLAAEVKNQDPDKIPYAKKMAVAKFLGTPLDSSMTPQAIVANQASLASPQLGTQQAAPTGRRGGAHALSKLNPASRVMTQTQDSEEDTK